MKIYCKIENALSRNLPNGRGGYEIKTFNFVPGQPVEIPDEYAQAILNTRSNQEIFFSEQQWNVHCQENKIDNSLEAPVSDAPVPDTAGKEELIEDNLTKEELEMLEIPELVEIARDMGCRTAMPTWKKETLINKILGV